MAYRHALCVGGPSNLPAVKGEEKLVYHSTQGWEESECGRRPRCTLRAIAEHGNLYCTEKNRTALCAYVQRPGYILRKFVICVQLPAGCTSPALSLDTRGEELGALRSIGARH